MLLFENIILYLVVLRETLYAAFIKYFLIMIEYETSKSMGFAQILLQTILSIGLLLVDKLVGSVRERERETLTLSSAVGSQCQPLQQVLRRVCWQVSDLSASSSLIVVR